MMDLDHDQGLVHIVKMGILVMNRNPNAGGTGGGGVEAKLEVLGIPIFKDPTVALVLA